MAKEKEGTKLCKHCKTEIPADAKVCPNCRKKQGGKKKWIVLGIAVVIVLILIINSGNDYDLSEDAGKMSEKDYKKACEEFKYKDVAKNPDKYKGKKAHFKGQIQQVVYESENGESEYLVNVTEDDLGLWDDGVYVYIDLPDDSEKYLEEEVIEMYGELSGEKSYTSVLGQAITVPAMTCVYFESTE